MYTIKTQKFSDVSILIRTLCPLDRKTITAYNLLVYMLKAKTEHFKSKQDLSMALNHAYGMGVSYSLVGYGKQLAFDIRFRYIREDYISDPDYSDEVLKIMNETLYHPILDEETLHEAKYFLQTRLSRIEEDPDSKALKEAFSILGDDLDGSIPIQGYEEKIESITLDDIHKLYSSYLDRPKSIFVCGWLSPPIEEFLSQIASTVSIENKMELIDKKSPSYIFLNRNVSQTSIVQIYQTGISFDSALYYPLLVLNSILGRGPISLLFEEIREKHSCCYSISSSLIRFDGALLISVGTNRLAIDTVLDLIRQQIDRLKEGNFDQSYLEIAQLDLIDQFNRQQDQPWSMIEQTFLDTLLNRNESLRERIEKIRSVTKEDVERAASNLSLISMAVVEEN